MILLHTVGVQPSGVVQRFNWIIAVVVQDLNTYKAVGEVQRAPHVYDTPFKMCCSRGHTLHIAITSTFLTCLTVGGNGSTSAFLVLESEPENDLSMSGVGTHLFSNTGW